jgi:hypothetical protein
VGIPSVQKMSLTATGMPASGRSGSVSSSEARVPSRSAWEAFSDFQSSALRESPAAASR